MMKTLYKIPNLPFSYDLETKPVLKQLNLANKKLAELKGIAQTIPNEQIQRKTAAKYLDMIVETKLLDKIKMGRSNYYINESTPKSGIFEKSKIFHSMSFLQQSEYQHVEKTEKSKTLCLYVKIGFSEWTHQYQFGGFICKPIHPKR